MTASPDHSMVPTPLPAGVTCREDLDGVHITLPPPTWSQLPTLHSLITITGGLLGFALSFFLAMMAVSRLNLSPGLAAGLGFAGMFLLMKGTDKLRTWHHKRLHRVHLTLTTTMIDIKHRRYQHTAYLSSARTVEGGVVDLWRDAHSDVQSRIRSQPEEVRDWTVLLLQAWLQRHLSPQGSHDEVPRQLQQLSAAAQPPS